MLHRVDGDGQVGGVDWDAVRVVVEREQGANVLPELLIILRQIVYGGNNLHERFLKTQKRFTAYESVRSIQASNLKHGTIFGRLWIEFLHGSAGVLRITDY